MPSSSSSSRTFLVVLWALIASLTSTADPGGRARDGLLTDAAAVPSRGTVRVTGGAGLARDAREGTAGDVGALPFVGGSAMWSPFTDVAAEVSGELVGGRIAPAVSVRWQALSEERAPVDVTTSLRFRSVGMEGVGSEIDLRLAVGKTLGPISVTGNALVGKGIGARGDVDFEASALVAWGIGDHVHIGMESRVHGELVDELVTEEDVGRPAGVVVGPAASAILGPVQLQGLVGWGAPRGQGDAGAVGMALASFDF